MGFGFGPRTKPKPKIQRDPDSEFNSLQFGIEIKKFLRKKNILGLKNFVLILFISKLKSKINFHRNSRIYFINITVIE